MPLATKLVDQAEFHRLARARAASGVGVLRPTGRVLRAEGEGDRGVSFVFSDNSVDRAGDKIFQEGWDLSEFRRNACVLWAHDSSAPPIGRVRNIRVENNSRLVGTIEFAAPQTYEFADLIFRLVKGGFISATSVGFLPTLWRFSEDKARAGGIDFLKAELLEISVVPIGCNANALIAASAAGLNVAPLRRWAEGLLAKGHTSRGTAAAYDPARADRARRARHAAAIARAHAAVVLAETRCEQAERESRIRRAERARAVARAILTAGR